MIQQLGKKYTNLPEAKQIKVKAEIQKLAEDVTYEELRHYSIQLQKKRAHELRL